MCVIVWFPGQVFPYFQVTWECALQTFQKIKINNPTPLPSLPPPPPTHTHTHTSVSQLPHTDSDLRLNADPSSVPNSGSVSPEQTWLETDQLGVEETRDLLVSVMFVLKHLDNGK